MAKPPVLGASPGWGQPTGPHGELRVSLNSTDAQIREIVRQRLHAEKLPSSNGVISFKRYGIDNGEQIIAFEVN